ncbi:MAG TPA: hypothetical protein VJZ71_14770 [Phycisphaerae bacterium]|nr:hypothetical protein [Phycisphaerae bacterium]
MKSLATTASLCLTVSFLAGCLPEKRIVWSPDGRRAAVATPQGLYFIDADGKVLPPKLPNTPARCDWFPDGKQLAVVHTQKAKGWNEIKGLFTPQQIETLTKLAKGARTQLLAHDGAWDDFKLDFKLDAHDQYSSGMQLATLLCMRDEHAEGVAEKLGDKWVELRELDATIWMLQFFTISADALAPGAVIIRSLDEIRQPRVAPDAKNIAFIMSPADFPVDTVSLHVVSAVGGPSRIVADRVAIDYSWSPDSRNLAYIHCPSPRGDEKGMIQLGSLTTVNIADESGALLKEWTQRQDRVGLLFNDVLGVRWLRDGRLIFSSVEVTLPATPRDMPQQWSLFVLDPRMPASVTRVLARDLGQPRDMALPLFELSPDESKVLLPGQKGRVSLYEFASGEETPIVAKDDAKGETRALPSWRNNSEITAVFPNPENDPKGPAQIMLWKAGQSRPISDAWPKEMKDGWLIKE